MNLTLFLPDLRGGGAERVTLDLAHAFKALGHSVDLLVMQEDGEYLQEAREHFMVHSLNAPRVRNAVVPLIAHLLKYQPDGLIAMMWPLTVLAPFTTRLVSRRTRVGVVEHGMLDQTYSDRGNVHRAILCATVGFGYRLAHARIGVSRGVAADMARMAGLPLQKVDAVANPIRIPSAIDPFRPRRENALWHGNGPRILTVGNLKPVKNHTLLLRAFARVSKTTAQLAILGRGDMDATLRALAIELGVADRVLFPGFQDPAPFYETADLFVLSSDSEGFGNVLVEALSFGLPVVSTDCPSGPREILGDGLWGKLVPVRDADALARAIDETLVEPVDRAVLKARAADFAPEIAARRYLSLLGLT